MIVEVRPKTAELSAGYRLLKRIREGKCHVLVHPYCLSRRWHGFAYLITDGGRSEVRLVALGVLIREGAVRVNHVFQNGQILYEAVN